MPEQPDRPEADADSAADRAQGASPTVTDPRPGSGSAGSSGGSAAAGAPAVRPGPQGPPDEPGLTRREVAERVAAGRTNDVPVRASRTVAQIIRGNVFTRINAMIAVLFSIIAVIGPVQDGLFAMVILINTLIGIVQELRAKRTLDKLAIVNAARPRVVRDGATTRVAAQEIVLDEVLEVGVGDQIVVDGTVTWAGGLEVDESLLTGEADPVVKQPGDTVMSGSFVVAGTGRFRATKVGRHAYAARLAEEASRFSLVRSELRSGINRILTWITFALFPIGALLVYSQLFMGGHVTLEEPAAGGRISGPLADALRGMVAALVSMIPEGLILLTSIAFAVGVIRLGRHRCLVQELPAIEGLARVDVVCTDKTGTLTEAGMRLTEIRDLGGYGDGPPPSRVLAALAAGDPDHNASMAAIAHGCEAGGLSAPDWPVAALAPFSSARKWSGASFLTSGGEEHWVLGAADVLLPSEEPAAAEAARLGAQGHRVMLLARASARVDSEEAPGPVVPVALVVLDQRVREDAGPTLDYFGTQGVDVKIVSGDHAASVGAVGRELGLSGADRPVDARSLSGDGGELAREVEERSAFGRVTPERKRDMVRGLRERGHTVAMTGDGVNDVLALKEADIGVAMGSGSPASRSVSQLVLLDDRFATLPRVVAEGRRVIGNIERVAGLFLTKTVYTMTLAIIVGLLAVAYPFFPRHATLINAVTFGIPSFFLALAPNTDIARPGFVMRTLRLAIPSGMVAGFAAVTTYLLVLGGRTVPDPADRTAVVITLCATTLWVLLLVAKPYVWWKVLLVGSMVGLLTLAMVTPLGQWFFDLDVSDPAKVLTGLAVAGVAIVAITVIRVVDDRMIARSGALSSKEGREEAEERAPEPV
ncbi:magnesium-transporting ATPase [Nocardiopsis sp. TSRI0078]|uniref:HAD-IC family P-type ATPase n=1 Tax=unclassified Nocardiopsis TaxID=2649073 RepID=UPI000939F9BE|nr:HAD-IC family P-type ATPase [Nocardiopsis sp. TSRI0078]OKI17344.1 magnesium-transporting ATPase [Nocardiopsis sp. TSRI0078]